MVIVYTSQYKQSGADGSLKVLTLVLSSFWSYLMETTLGSYHRVIPAVLARQLPQTTAAKVNTLHPQRVRD